MGQIHKLFNVGGQAPPRQGSPNRRIRLLCTDIRLRPAFEVLDMAKFFRLTFFIAQIMLVSLRYPILYHLLSPSLSKTISRGACLSEKHSKGREVSLTSSCTNTCAPLESSSARSLFAHPWSYIYVSSLLRCWSSRFFCLFYPTDQSELIRGSVQSRQPS